MGVDENDDNHIFYNKYAYSGRNPFRPECRTSVISRIEWKYYDRTSDKHTLVLNTRADWGDDLDPDNQVTLGARQWSPRFSLEQMIFPATKDGSLTPKTGYIFN